MVAVVVERACLDLITAGGEQPHHELGETRGDALGGGQLTELNHHQPKTTFDAFHRDLTARFGGVGQ